MSKGRVSLSYSLAWIVFVVMFAVFFFQVANGAKLRDIVDFASTPYPTAQSGGQQAQDNEQVSNNTNSIVLHVAPTAQPIAPTPQPTATPAPTVTPQPTATQQPTVTPVWSYMVGTSEALQRRIVALENAPTPQGEVVGFVHYGTAGVTLLIGVIVWGLVSLFEKRRVVGEAPPIQQKQGINRPELVINQTQTTPNQSVNHSEPTVISGLTARQSAELTKARGRIEAKAGSAFSLFGSPHTSDSFTSSEANRIRYVSKKGASKNEIIMALWGQKNTARLKVITEILENE